MSAAPFRSGMLVFPNLTQLDLTGPYEVLARLPGSETLLLWKTLDPVRSERGLTILPMATLAACPPLDLILVPGGPGVNPLLEDAEVLGFLRRAAAEAIQLAIEYDPAPPFAAGSPEGADPAVRAAVLDAAALRRRERAERVTRAAAAFDR